MATLAVWAKRALGFAPPISAPREKHVYPMEFSSLKPGYDVSLAVDKGRRDYQEDSVFAEFPDEDTFGFAILADGMGGHAAGDVASKIVVEELRKSLREHAKDQKGFEGTVDAELRKAADIANERIKQNAIEMPENTGMGSTLVAPVFFGKKLYWISIGDSPLFLYRKGVLKQLNEDHSLAPQIDLMVKTGQLDPEVAKRHPDRNCLTSVLMGQRVPKIDCTDTPTDLESGDIVIVSSDGLQFLEDDEICDILKAKESESSAVISDALLSATQDLDDPDQDNISFAVVKIF